jgi:hypothetical protein
MYVLTVLFLAVEKLQEQQKQMGRESWKSDGNGGQSALSGKRTKGHAYE